MPSTAASATILLVPGIGDSGPAHWQSRWQAAHPEMRRVVQRDWDHPRCDDWCRTLDEAIDDARQRADTPPLLVAHSLGCLVVAHWAARGTRPARAAMLVAVPDPAGPSFPREATGFAPLPMQRLGFPSLVVASSNDPYGSLDHARRCAAAWGSRLVEAGAAGHLNADSGLGDWPQGLAWCRELAA